MTLVERLRKKSVEFNLGWLRDVAKRLEELEDADRIKELEQSHIEQAQRIEELEFYISKVHSQMSDIEHLRPVLNTQDT